MTLIMNDKHLIVNHLDLLSDDELIEKFNLEVGNFQWSESRGKYLSTLHSEFRSREFDSSSVFINGKISLKKHIQLLHGKLCFI